MSEAPFVFKCALNGQPISPDQFGKMSVRAVLAFFEHSKPKTDGQPLSLMQVSSVAAAEVTAVVLQRIDPSVTGKAMLDEDFDEVMRAFEHICACNPGLFPKKASQTKQDESPKGAPPT